MSENRELEEDKRRLEEEMSQLEEGEELDREPLTRDDIASRLLNDKEIGKIIPEKELFPILVYGAFQSIKSHLKLVTFDDSLIFASKLLIENPVILESVQRKV